MQPTRSSRYAKKKRRRQILSTVALILAVLTAAVMIVAFAPGLLEQPKPEKTDSAQSSEGPKQSTPSVSTSSDTTGSTPANSTSTPSAAGGKRTPKPTVSGAAGSSVPSKEPQKDPQQEPDATGNPGAFTDKDRIHLSFMGDVLLAGSVQKLLDQKGYDYPYQDVKSYIQQADFAIADLESPVTLRGDAQTKEYVYRANPAALPSFKKAGFDLVTLANNHTIDYGEQGLLDTFDHLKANGIPYVGAGQDADEAYKPVILKAKGISIAFLGFSRIVPNGSWKAGPNHPGVAETYDYNKPVEAIKKAKAQADLVVVLPHWGIERQDTPEPYQKELARRYIDAGADLVVGDHPHVVQGFEQYKGKWIAYSLGNFIFTTNDKPKTNDSMILQAACTQKGECSIEVLPIFTRMAKPERMQPDAAAALFSRLSAVSYGAKLLKDGQVVSTTETH
ncbi:CapA family protein [Gorillibacterium massiliense]|uniref:CapA family protein n=1 Tax=Gorillibacterium massiliense TaxID=1280390 RepID=UPI0004B7669F|nr:CapA family protein [Gorillibacterium massiliense]